MLHAEYSVIQSLPLSSVVNFNRSNIAALRSENYDTGQYHKVNFTLKKSLIYYWDLTHKLGLLIDQESLKLATNKK